VSYVLKRAGHALRQALGKPADPDAMPGMDEFERTVEGVMSRQSTRRAQTIVRVPAWTR
jgi:hypothetical protein